MIRTNYSIAFNFQVDRTSLVVALHADVELHHSREYYVVKNIAPVSNPGRPILPDLTIKKMNGQWVHCDSEKETELSTGIGNAIDKYPPETET